MDINTFMKEYPTSWNYIVSFTSNELIKTQQYIKNKGKVATGELIRSLEADIDFQGEDLIVKLEYAPHGKWVDSGRRRGAKQPPMSSVEKWIRVRGIKQKNKMTPKQLAFLIARAIKLKGIKAIKFISKFQKAYATKQFVNGLTKQMEKDTINNIKTKINANTINK